MNESSTRKTESFQCSEKASHRLKATLRLELGIWPENFSLEVSLLW